MIPVVALFLIVGVLVVIVYPLYTRRSPIPRHLTGGSLLELDERYRAALADLQDTEMDWEVGNLAEADYLALRERYRLRAAQTLREIDVRQALQDAVRGEVRRAAARPSDPGTANQEFATIPAQSRGGVRFFVVVGGIAALVAVGGIGLLYVRTMEVQAAQAPRATLPISHAHAVTLDEDGEMWVGHHEGLLRSRDGSSWESSTLAGDVLALVDLGGRRLAMGHNVLSESSDGGNSWRPLTHDLPGTDVHGAARGRSSVYAYVVGFGLYRSGDGRGWERQSDPLAQEVGSLAVQPREQGAEVVYLAAGGTVLRSTDGGRTWSSAAGAVNLAISGFVNGVATDPVRGALYAASTDGLFRSLSGGSDWARLPFRGRATAVGARADRVGVVDDQGRFFLSTDGGGSWLSGS